MTQSTKIDLKQREHLVALVEQAKRDERSSLEEKNLVSKSAVLREIAKEKGVHETLKNIEECQTQISALQQLVSEHERTLRKRGFDWTHYDLSLRWDAPEAVQSALQRRMEQGRIPIDKALKRYDIAVATIWAASTPEAMQKVVEGIIHL